MAFQLISITLIKCITQPGLPKPDTWSDKVCGEGQQVLWAHRRGGRPGAGAAASRMLGRGRRGDRAGRDGLPFAIFHSHTPPPPRPFFCKSKPPSAVTSVLIHLFPLICSLAAKCSGDSLISVLMLQFCSHRPPLHSSQCRVTPPRLPSVSMARGRRGLWGPERAAGVRGEERRSRCFPHPGCPSIPQQLSASTSGSLIPALLLPFLRQMLGVGRNLPCFPFCSFSCKLAQLPHLWRGSHLGDREA